MSISSNQMNAKFPGDNKMMVMQGEFPNKGYYKTFGKAL